MSSTLTSAKDGLDIGVHYKEFGVPDARERLKYYRQFVYEKGYIDVSERERINSHRHTQRHTDIGAGVGDQRSEVGLFTTKGMKKHEG